MGAAAKGAPPQFLSTHPSGSTRIQDIEANLPKVMPLYERSAKPPQRFDAPRKTGQADQPDALAYWGVGGASKPEAAAAAAPAVVASNTGAGTAGTTAKPRANGASEAGWVRVTP